MQDNTSKKMIWRSSITFLPSNFRFDEDKIFHNAKYATYDRGVTYFLHHQAGKDVHVPKEVTRKLTEYIGSHDNILDGAYVGTRGESPRVLPIMLISTMAWMITRNRLYSSL